MRPAIFSKKLITAVFIIAGIYVAFAISLITGLWKIENSHFSILCSSLGVNIEPPIGFITLTDADGIQYESEIVANFLYDGMNILGLLSSETSEISLYAYREDPDDPDSDEPVLYEIPDQKYDMVLEYFTSMLDSDG